MSVVTLAPKVRRVGPRRRWHRLAEQVAFDTAENRPVATTAVRALCGRFIRNEDVFGWSVSDRYTDGSPLPICEDCQGLYFRGKRR